LFPAWYLKERNRIRLNERGGQAIAGEGADYKAAERGATRRTGTDIRGQDIREKQGTC
jgi:hypothetical protein